MRICIRNATTFRPGILEASQTCVSLWQRTLGTLVVCDVRTPGTTSTHLLQLPKCDRAIATDDASLDFASSQAQLVNTKGAFQRITTMRGKSSPQPRASRRRRGGTDSDPFRFQLQQHRGYMLGGSLLFSGKRWNGVCDQGCLFFLLRTAWFPCKSYITVHQRQC